MGDLTRRGFIFGSATLASYGLLVGVQRACFSAFANGRQEESNPGPVTIVQFADDGMRTGAKSVAKLRRTNDEWKKLLTPAQYEVTHPPPTQFPSTAHLSHHH